MLVQALEDKTNGLHEQRMHQLALERECSRLRLQLERLRELQPQLNGQRLLSQDHMHAVMLLPTVISIVPSYDLHLEYVRMPLLVCRMSSVVIGSHSQSSASQVRSCVCAPVRAML